MKKEIILKDDKLEEIRRAGGNIARFLSISPEFKEKHVNIGEGYKTEGDIRKDIVSLIKASKGKSVNIRSFSESSMKSCRFVYGKRLEDINEIMEIIKENCSEGKYSIVNETIDVNDGGVSGVLLNNIIEFAPNDTPRCVEKPGSCRMERGMGLHMLETVYGFYPATDMPQNYRTEFSLHPAREGLLGTNTIVWEFEEFPYEKMEVKMEWPNRFSKFIGDKAFGLIVADYLGFNVPKTTVIARNVPPFTFGKDTGLNETWIRTAPVVKEPGKYFTGDRWQDPFELMAQEESKGEKDINIASILSQKAVEALYSGGAIVGSSENEDLIESVKGKGDDFMTGKYEEEISEEAKEKLKAEMERLRAFSKLLGNVSIEWVYDGKQIWIVQLNQIRDASDGHTIVKGEASRYEKFDVSLGLEALREKIREIEEGTGIELMGEVGISSHFGDVLRQAQVPSFIKRKK